MLSSPNPSPGLNNVHWNSLVIPLAATICTILLLISYCTILKKLCRVHNGVNFSRNRVGRRPLNEANPDDPSLQFHSRGLEPSIIHSLPITQFKKQNEEQNQIHTDCAVCLEEFEEREWLKHLPNCVHAFHVSCIDIWFQSHSNCPLCRTHAYDFTIHREYSVSVDTLQEILRREDST